MRNGLLPTMSSRLHSYGNDEVELENLKACMQMDDLMQLSEGGSKVMPSQSQTQCLIQQGSCEIGSLYGISNNNKDISHQSISLPSKRPSDSQCEGVGGDARKRPFEAIHNMEANSQTKITNFEPKWHHQKFPRNKKLHVSVRRNQKLSDKITILQKLVSPFGKTDAASVLREASLYIRLLHEQIRNLFQTVSFSYNNTVKVPHNQVDLRSRGLCLVPISMTQKVTMGDQIHRHDAISVSSRIMAFPKISNAI